MSALHPGERKSPTIVARCFAAFLVAGALLIAPVPSLAAEAPEQLAKWREQALALVNQAREEHGLPALTLGPQLNEAAQMHAADMFDRDYYAHTSPEGDTVQDRYMDAGGSRWKFVAENIARCEECTPPITAERVERLQTGWMNSPPHREAILGEGLENFGYGIVLGADNGLYAVQTFAGPGTPRGLASGEEPRVLDPANAAARMADLLNRARERQNLGALNHSEALDAVANSVLPPPESETIDLDTSGDLFSALPEGERTAWRRVSVIAGVCGGCGKEPTEADLRSFREQWLDNPQYSRQLLGSTFSSLGFALQVNGEGRKVAVLVLAARR
ncbi:CAP domain-containing protein [Tianweitania sediminis]|uniref:SCP domain-containing protein n=1 Tax=Tianweitania sediminis TaxID=1502156 RepID=A0A8J7ULS9_9HYPH|nr:CAP domain-containing protein [Tianweitania sediminis]MBP0441074.1 hypothetical protein [Tianweitania sediminis]